MDEKIFGLFLWGIIVSGLINAQELNKKVFSQEAGKEILLGKGTRAGMQQEPFKKWFDEEYKAYQVNDSLTRILKGTLLSGMDIMVILGTWCSDSQREVPRFFKVADGIKIPDEHIKIIYVDRDKTVPGMDMSNYDLERVPTFIFYLNGKEISRIVEVPDGSFENEFERLFDKTLFEKDPK